VVFPDRFKRQTANLLNQMGTSEKVPTAFVMMRFCPRNAGLFANDLQDNAVQGRFTWFF